jgi:hypothetical protein
MTRFETALGRLAVVNADLGAHIALRAIIDLLERHNQHEALELIAQFGQESVNQALTVEAWRNEQLPAGGVAPVPTDTKSRDNGSTGGNDANQS